MKWSRPLPAQPSSVTVIKNKAGQYHVSFVVEVHPESVEPVRESIGLDLGLKTFAFPSVGEPIKAPDYSRLDRRIRRLQKRLARQQKGSNRRVVTKQKIAKLHLKIRNIRKDFLHKTSTQLLRENQTVCLEDLNVSGMVRNRRLARAISQQGWREFRTMLESKAAQYIARSVFVVSRWEPTSQTCSCCGFRWGKLSLSVRSVRCISCGTQHDRDQNAAKNIEQSGRRMSDSKGASRAHKPAVSVAMPREALSQPCGVQLSLCI